MTNLLSLTLGTLVLALSTFSHSSFAQDSKNESVEKLAPNSNYPSAFVGQTRIEGIKTKELVQGKVLASGLKRP